MNTPQYWLALSRPRFWMYVLGPAGLGAMAGVGSGSIDGGVILLLVTVLVFFTFPLNLFIYGINDLFDADTDALNPKKQKQEVLLQSARRQSLRRILILITILSALISLFLPPPARIAWFLFLFLGWSYSAPPLRWKIRLFLDAYSNVLYVFPAWVTYGLLTSQWLDSRWLILGLFWTAGMHTFSAVPDISADRTANVRTSAVVFGREKALLFVGLNWIMAVAIALYLAGPFGLIMLIYPSLVVVVYFNWQPIERVYWWFPWINGIVGTCSFWAIYFVNLPIL